jgi:hypothetical protein
MNPKCKELLSLAYDEGLVPATEYGDFSCAFVGEWNAGKTSLINAMTGTVLPEGAKSTTKTVVRIRKADELESIIFCQDNSVKRETGEAAWGLADQAAREHVKKLEYSDPQADLPENSVFIDTPGFNDQDTAANTTAEGVRADMIVFVLQAGGSTLNEVQKQYIDEVLRAKGHDLGDIFFVFTHSDMLQGVEDKEASVNRFLEQYGWDMLKKENFFFVALPKNGPKEGIDPLKTDLYAYMRKRMEIKLPERMTRFYRELKNRMRQRITEKEALIDKLQDEKGAKIEKLHARINLAYKQEREKRQEIRSRQKERMRQFNDQLGRELDSISDELEIIVDKLNSKELKLKGNLEQEIANRIKARLEPQIKQKMEELQQEINQDIALMESASFSLLDNLGLNLPRYSSRLPTINAEAIVPLAVVSSLVIAGPFSLVTIGLGIIAWNADKFGLTKGGVIIDAVKDKIKSAATAAHKRIVKQTINKSLSDFRINYVKQLRNITDKVIEHKISQLNSVEKIRQQMEELKSDFSVDKSKQWIEDVNLLLELCAE